MSHAVRVRHVRAYCRGRGTYKPLDIVFRDSGSLILVSNLQAYYSMALLNLVPIVTFVLLTSSHFTNAAPQPEADGKKQVKCKTGHRSSNAACCGMAAHSVLPVQWVC